MKIAVLIARILLGLLFLVFGLNTFLHFIPMQLPPGDAGAIAGLMFKHGWSSFIGVLQVIGGALLLIGRFVPLGLVILSPIIVVILLYHITLAPEDIGLGLIAAILAIFLIWAYREHFKPLFESTLRQL